MYGSVAALDIVRLFEKEGIAIERRHVLLPLPIKALGVHSINLKLKEGVPAHFTLKVHSGGEVPMEEAKQSPPPSQE
jgi:large subunit ribosomal protein L9